MTDLAIHMPAVAAAILGAPNESLSSERELKFGEAGKLSIDVAAGTWFDEKADDGGDVLDFIRVYKKLEGDAALAWLRDTVGEPAPAKTNGAHHASNDAAKSDNGAEREIDLHPELEAERALIGLIFIRPQVLALAEEEVAASDFLMPLHRAVFGLFIDARDQDYRADIKTVVAALIGEGHKPPEGFTVATYVARLAAAAPFHGEEEADDLARALARQVREVAEVERGKEPEPESTAPPVEKLPPPRFRLVHFGDVKLSARPRYLVRGLIPLTGVVVIWGPPKCGKSFWTSDLLFHVALGWDYRGRKVVQGAVVYVILEGETGFSDRIEAFRQRYLADKNPPPFYVISQKLNLVADHLQLIVDIRAQLPPGVKPAVVAIDTLNRSLQGSESSDQDMGNYVKAADAIRVAFDCVVPIVHHCGIESARPRGHSSLTGAADAQIAVRRDAAKNVVATVEYMKDGPEGDVINSRLEVVTVGKEPDGHPITSCVVVQLGLEEAMAQKSAVQGFALKPTEEPVFRALLTALRKASKAPDAEMVALGVPADTFAVHYRDWREAYKTDGVKGGDAGEAPSDDAIRKQFDRYSRFMISSGGVMGWKRPWLWWTGKHVRGFPETRPKDRTTSGQWADEAPDNVVPSTDGQRTGGGHNPDDPELF